MFSDIEKSFISDDIHAIHTSGFHTVGIGGASYTRIYTQLDPKGLGVWWIEAENGAIFTIDEEIVNPYMFGARGDGVFDDTTPVQCAINYKTTGDIILSGHFKIRNITVEDKVDFALIGDGLVLSLTDEGFGHRNGIELRGKLEDVTIRNITVIGMFQESSDNAGIYSLSGVVINRMLISEIVVKGCSVGISVNANLAGQIRDLKISRCTIIDTVGVRPGTGYGIHFADGSGIQSNVVIEQNAILRATRHSIYLAKGKSGTVKNNLIIGHRIREQTGQYRSAIIVLRSSDVAILGNIILNSHDGAIFVGKSGVNGSNVLVQMNLIVSIEQSSVVPCIVIGSPNPGHLDPDINDGSTIEGSPENVLIRRNNIVLLSGINFARVNSGINIRFTENLFIGPPVCTTCTNIDVRAYGGPKHSKHIFIE